DQITQILGPMSSNITIALIILIVGWIVALAVSSTIGKALRRTSMDEKIVRMALGEERARSIDSNQWITRIIYYVLLFFVVVAFFEALGLTMVAQPLNAMLTVVFAYIPKLFAAILIAIVAIVLAMLLRRVILRVLRSAKVDEGLGSKAGLEGKEMPLSQTIAEIVFYLVLLLFLPMVLNALSLGGLLEPLQVMMAKMLSFLPNLLAAAVILLLGWFVARIVQRILTSLLVAFGSERLSERVGLSRVLGQRGLAGLLGLVVYALILIPVLMAALQALDLVSVTGPISNMLNQILAAIPSVFGAILILAIAYVLGKIVAELATNLLAAAGFDSILVWLGLGKEPAGGEKSPSQVAGILVLAAIMLFALIEASTILNFTLMADLIYEFIIFAGQVLMGLVILALGIYLANLAYSTVMASNSSQAKILAQAARISILVFSGAVALRHMGLADEIINLAFGLLLGAIAVAIALAFGLGGREIAAQEIERWLRSLR
ncbi:mechanosensitive ion channel, partial [Methanothrix sp.]|uniref:mechanosensitive ion channel n=1 Tax=Methanothrix sp. TaxID=90426 RepID=UPI003C72938A